MNQLESLASAMLDQWHAAGEPGNGPIPVGDLLDRVLPYRVARRLLGIDVSEDFEALVLRLLAEEDDLVRVEPVDAADLARATVSTRLPDLDVLQLLRSATVTVTERAARRLRDLKRTAPAVSEAAPPIATTAAPVEPGMLEPLVSAVAAECWSCSGVLPADRPVKFCPYCGADQRDPACPSCGAAVERGWQHCPDCGTRLRAA